MQANEVNPTPAEVLSQNEIPDRYLIGGEGRFINVF
jgi:hypothetical protein